MVFKNLDNYLFDSMGKIVNYDSVIALMEAIMGNITFLKKIGIRVSNAALLHSMFSSFLPHYLKKT